MNLQYKSLIESLRLLASSFENQVEYLPDYVDVKDEVINTFCDAFLLLPQLIENGLLNKEAIASVLRCFNWMNMIVLNDSTSDLESFKNHESWGKVRILAAKALDEMEEEKGKPDLSHIEWIS